jgi:hypothetical protein
MNDSLPGGARRSSIVRYTRLPLLALAATLSMGSGMGNPGCGDEDLEVDCVGGCEIQGTYQLTFTDTSPLGPECDELSVSLPTGPLVLTRELEDDDAIVTSTLGDVELSGSYLGIASKSLFLSGTGRTALLSGNQTVTYKLVFDGSFASDPKRASDPATFSGTFTLEQQELDGDGASCTVSRAFTATR